MAVVKVIEIMAQSSEGWEDATKQAIKEAAKTVDNIESVWIKEMKAIVENNEITSYRVDAMISFVVK